MLLQETNRTIIMRLPDGTVKKQFKNISHQQFSNVVSNMISSYCSVPIYGFDSKEHSYTMPYYECTLTQYLQKINILREFKNKQIILEQLADAIFEIWGKGLIHNDFHANNIFVLDSYTTPRILIADWEHVSERPNNQGAFSNCQDLIGGGKTHAHWDKNGDVDIGKLLGVKSDWVINYIKEKILKHLSESSGAYWERNSPGQIYGDINLPDFQIQGRRNPKDRLDAFGVDFIGKTVLDVGSNTGSIAFEAYNRGASNVSGLELRTERVKVANEIAAFTGINHKVNFTNLNILEHEIVPHNIVICFALDHQVKNPKELYQRLHDITTETLLFETSKQPHELDWVKEQLLKAGFKSINYIGDSAKFDKKKRSRHMFLGIK